MKREAGVVEPSTLNIVLSDGKRMFTTRYVSKDNQSNSLSLLTGV